MCGFVGMFENFESGKSFSPEEKEELRLRVLKMAKKIRHRGPDWSGIYTGDNAIIAHERLAIVDPFSGKQPLFSPDGKVILAVNGEIYNHTEIRKRYEGRYPFRTKSDCEVILALYEEKGTGFLEDLNGIFAFCLYDSRKNLFMTARDHIGIIPLYHGWDGEGRYYAASELKALEGVCCKYEEFPPGSFYTVGSEKPVRWYHRRWESYDAVKDNSSSVDALRDGLEAAVRRQLMSDVPYGVLLSGGLDSSVIAAITKKFASRRIETLHQLLL